MSSSPIDIVKVFFGTFSLMGADKAGIYLSQDFKLVGLTSEEMGKDAWVGFLKALKTALPDMKIRLLSVIGSGNQVQITEVGMGTHVTTLDLSLFGLPAVPAAGLHVTFPEANWVFTVEDGKITRCELVSPPSPQRGLAGMQSALSAAFV